MHVKIRVFGKSDAVVVVKSKLTKIEEFRKLIRDKFHVKPLYQRLMYGGKLLPALQKEWPDEKSATRNSSLENGYTFHDYNIKYNDVIQLMVHQNIYDDPFKKAMAKREAAALEYEDAESIYYAIGDKVDVRDSEEGVWLEAKIRRIVKNPNYKPSESSKQTVSSKKKNIENEEPMPETSSTSQPNTSTKSKCSGALKKSPKGSPQNNTLLEYFKVTAKREPTESGANIVDDSMDTEEMEQAPLEDDLLYMIESDTDIEYKDHYYCKLSEIRPRARKELDVCELRMGMTVMLNHNTEYATEKGYWYDFKIREVCKRKTGGFLIGILYLGDNTPPKDDTRAIIHDKIFAIEEVVPLAERTEEYSQMMVTPTEKRSTCLDCLTCRDDITKPCKDCGCYVCSAKEEPAKIVLCDECNHGYHINCVEPPLEEVPEDDWYCPDCKRDNNAVVAPGRAKQAKKTVASKTKRDWGRGMACVGKTKSSVMPPNHFGPIPGIEVGMGWRFRIQLSETGVHRPPVSGIHGRDEEGAYSIVLSGGYEDDYDDGYEFIYTGSGGRDLSGNKRTAEQSCDQTLTRENRALARNCAAKAVSDQGGDADNRWREGKPVRVVRSFKMAKHFPMYAPKEGIRYDGIYKVVKYYPEKGKSGFRVWKYLLRRDDPNIAPWEPSAKKFSITYPDGYKEAQAEKKKAAAAKKKGKGKNMAKRPVPGKSQDSASEDETAPPAKKQKSNFGNKPKPKKKGLTSSSSSSSSEDDDDEDPMTSQSAEMSNRKRTNSDRDKASDSDEVQKPADVAPQKRFKGKGRGKKTRKVEDETPTAGEQPEGEGTVLNPEEVAIIKLDKVNAKLWGECLTRTRDKKGFVDHVVQEFLCIICQDVVSSPVTTSCLHNFCQNCLKLAFTTTKEKNCPHCRKDLTNEQIDINEQLDAALTFIMPGYNVGRK